MPAYLNIREAADYLGISPHTLYKLVEDDKVPAAKVGGSWRLNRAALDEFLSGGRSSPGKSPELLIVDSDESARRELASISISRGARVQLAGGADDVEVLLSAGPAPDLVLYGVPEDTEVAHDFMQRLRAISQDCRVALLVPPGRMAELAGLMAYG